MTVDAIRLQHFRSYDDVRFELSPLVNIVVGPNGSGKTNLLESVLFAATGSTYRARDMHVVMHGKPWSRIDVEVTGEITRTVKLQGDDEQMVKSFVIDGLPKKRLSAQTQLPVLLFEPDQLLLLSGDSAERREFLDGFSAHNSPSIQLLIRQYARIVKQRNALLKTAAPENHYFSWDIRMAELAQTIVAARSLSLATINEHLLTIYTELGGTARSLQLEYQTPFMVERYGEQLLGYLKQNFARDRERGFTGRGAHRDDFICLYDGVDARNKASRGELRTIVLALKIIELEVFRAGTKPIVLLDDVFSELDERRRSALAKRLSGHQVIITTTDADAIKKSLPHKKVNIIRL